MTLVLAVTAVLMGTGLSNSLTMHLIPAPLDNYRLAQAFVS
jgi:hypothetical protein